MTEMVAARLRVAIEDPVVALEHKLDPFELITISDEPFFLDGPVAARVAVVDRDSRTGHIKPVKWLPDPKVGKYVEDDISSPAGIAVSVFGIVLETLGVFERPDVLNHRVTWAFDSPQLLIVPRAGTWKNAYYDRYSRSLQCFSFAGPDESIVHTALSRDIIAHETGHAVLDGIVPPLYDALTPQTLALHEAIGDLTAIVMALQSRTIRSWLLREHHGDLSGSTPVSQLAEQFGRSLGLNRPLRDACNKATMKDIANDAGYQEPHDLCRVLTGAIWKAMVRVNEYNLEEAHRKSKGGPEGWALWKSSQQIGRILFRALDYLVPAEATFADYGRAILRSDEQAYPEDKMGFRQVLKDEFVRRGIVPSPGKLESRPEQEWVKVDIDNVLESDWAAYAFVERERKLLKVPPGAPFRLLPRQDVKRHYYLGVNQESDRREMVFRVTWEKPEENAGISGTPGKRGVFHGTTAVISGERDKRGRYRLLSCLTTDRSDDHVRSRNEMVRSLMDQGQLEICDRQAGVNARPLAPRVFGRVTDGTLRLRGTARLLHLTEIET